MVVSRLIARRRIAAGVRPGWIGAWGLVAIDTVALFAIMALVFRASQGLLRDWPTAAAIVMLILVFFIPLQIVLITSALWAARSRWTDFDAPPSRKDHDSGNHDDG